MKQEDKQLLLVDLCARLPYGVKCLVNFKGTKYTMTLKTGLPNSFGNWDFYNEKYSLCSNDFKPYLRPMSSMTLEELEEYRRFSDHIRDAECKIHIANYKQIDWLNAHHFDYRGLIEKGLAIEAPEGMYN